MPLAQITLNTFSFSEKIIDSTTSWTMLEQEDFSGKCLLGLITHITVIPIALLESTIAFTLLSIAKAIELGASFILSEKSLVSLNTNIVDPFSRYTFSAMLHVAIATTRLYTNFAGPIEMFLVETAITEKLSPFFASPSTVKTLNDLEEKICSKSSFTTEEIQQYIKAVKAEANNPHADIRELSLEIVYLLVSIFDCKEAFAPALELALAAKNDPNASIRKDAAAILNSLAIKNYPGAEFPSSA